MTNEFLIVIDMQNDFVTGALGTPEAVRIVPAVVEKVKHFSGHILFTQDTHFPDYRTTQEGKYLPVEHCILQTPGWELVPALQQIVQTERYPVYQKSTFASIALAQELADAHKKMPIDQIELVGLCTDICVVSNALCLKSLLPEVPIYVDAACCAGVTPQTHEAALKTMACCQIQIRRS